MSTIGRPRKTEKFKYMRVSLTFKRHIVSET